MARRFATPVLLPGAPTNTDEAATKGYVDTGLGGKSDSGHNHDGSYAATGHNHDGTYSAAGHSHSPALVPFSVQTLSSGATLTMDASTGKHFRCAALATNTTVAVPTNVTDGQALILEVVASGATRTLALNASIVNCSSWTFSVSIPSGKRWFFGFLISGSTAYLLSVAPQP